MMDSKLYRRIREALLRFPFHEFECTADIIVHADKGDGEEMIEALADMVIAAIPDLPDTVMDQADNRIDQLVTLWHAETNGTRDSLPELIRRLQQNQKVIVETMVSAEANKE